MSGIATGTALAIAGGVGAAGSIGGALISSNAAGNAASAQSNAANYAAQLQYQASQNALGFQQNQWNTSQQELSPYLQTGYNALSNLQYLLGIGGNGASGTGAGANSGYGYQSPLTNTTTPQGGPASGLSPNRALSSGISPSINNQAGESGGNSTGLGMPTPTSGPVQNLGVQSGQSGLPAGLNTNPSANPSLGGFGSLMQPYGQTFSAPTEAQMVANDPGYQARWNLQQQALQQSAAARGNLLTGGTSQALGQAAQDYASNEYGNYYNQAYNQFASNYNQYEQNQANQYNRLASLAGVGQTTAGQLGSLGQSAANGVSSNLLNTAQNMGQQYNNAAAANASGIVGSANAWGGALGNTGSSLSNLLMLQQLGALGNGSGGAISVNPNTGSILTPGYNGNDFGNQWG